MTTHTFPCSDTLDTFVKSCMDDLLAAEIQYKFIFPNGCSLQNWQTEKIKELNEIFLSRSQALAWECLPSSSA